VYNTDNVATFKPFYTDGSTRRIMSEPYPSVRLTISDFELNGGAFPPHNILDFPISKKKERKG
jgi:hypothetical protein